jgi:uncharacterized membrane-anchored protein
MIAALQSRWLPVIAAALAVAQIAVLGSMIWARASILRNGAEIALEVRPIDPRDLLRGDYVIVSYNISTLPKELFGGAKREDYSGPHTVFVRLKADATGIWQPVLARLDAPDATPPAAGEVDLRGYTGYWPAESDGSVSMDYGIERFYLPEGTGRPIEEGIGVRPFTMKVAVASDGVAQIKSFHDGDTLIYAEPLY